MIDHSPAPLGASFYSHESGFQMPDCGSWLCKICGSSISTRNRVQRRTSSNHQAYTSRLYNLVYSA